MPMPKPYHVDNPPWPYHKLKPLPWAALLLAPACLPYFISAAPLQSQTSSLFSLAYFICAAGGFLVAILTCYLLRFGLKPLLRPQVHLLTILFVMSGFSQFILLSSIYFPAFSAPLLERAWSLSHLSAGIGLLLLFLPIPRQLQNFLRPRMLLGAGVLIGLFMIAPTQWIPLPTEYLRFWLGLAMFCTLVTLFLSFRRPFHTRLMLPLRLTMASLLLADAFFSWSVIKEQVPSWNGLFYNALAAGWFFLPYFWQQKVSRIRHVSRSLLARTRTRNQSLRNDLHHSMQQQQLQLHVFKNISTITDTQESLTNILNALVKQVAQTIPAAHYIYLYLLEGNPPTFWVMAFHGSIPLSPISIEKKFMASRYMDGKPFMALDLSHHYHRMPAELVRAGALSCVGIPIQCHTKLAGVLEIYSHQTAAFTETEVNLLSLFARQAATAIASSRKVDACMNSAYELTLLNEIIDITSDQPSPALLLSKVSEKLGEFLHADAIAAFIMQRRGDSFLLVDTLAKNFSPDEINRLKDLFAKGSPKWLSEPPQYQPGMRSFIRLPLTNQKSIEVLPLFSRNVPQGIIIFLWDYNRKLETDTHTDATIRSIANQTAVNLERHYLFSSVQKIGLTDALTDLSNRRFFDYVLKREAARALRHEHPLSLLMFDIDHFKKINDTWGHVIGDAVLKELGLLIKQSFRSSDIPCRYGGEEFAVILPETLPKDAFALAERFRIIVMNHVLVPDTVRISLTISIGLATLEPGLQGAIASADELVLSADRCLYQAKQGGRNRTNTWRKL